METGVYLKTSNVFYHNEKKANATVARVMLITLALFTLVYILNLLHVFIIDFDVMTKAYVTSAVLLTTPLILNKTVGTEAKSLKYIYIGLTTVFLFIITTTLTFHSLVVYAYPIAVAGLYFRKKLMIYATTLTIIATTSAEFLGYHLQWLLDRNAYSFKALVLFCVLPRLICLISFASLLYLLTSRADELLMAQDKASKDLLDLNSDIISGFANLVENRDENTGGHIKRTSRYVELLARELMGKPGFEEITEDFIENLCQAAPMHDVGKIFIPDSILKKKGPLDPEEFATMKLHSTKGGEIIKASFNHVGDEKYRTMAYNVATYHHEKWNGNGYPKGLNGTDIPLCARIMAVADVFDAVSQNRCYRTAMPFEDCFNIIHKGIGTDFDPKIAEAFLKHRQQVEQIFVDVRDM